MRSDHLQRLIRLVFELGALSNQLRTHVEMGGSSDIARQTDRAIMLAIDALNTPGDDVSATLSNLAAVLRPTSSVLAGEASALAQELCV